MYFIRNTLLRIALLGTPSVQMDREYQLFACHSSNSPALSADQSENGKAYRCLLFLLRLSARKLQ